MSLDLVYLVIVSFCVLLHLIKLNLYFINALPHISPQNCYFISLNVFVMFCVQVALGMARLLYRLAHSPHGSLAMNDFKREQFVLVDGELKLSDADDITTSDPFCDIDSDCAMHNQNTNVTTVTPCLNHHCYEYNEKWNIMSGGRHFVSFFLKHGAPRSLLPVVDQLSSVYENITGNTRKLLDLTETLAKLYINGSYLYNGRSRARIGKNSKQRELTFTFLIFLKFTHSPDKVRINHLNNG